MLELYLNAKLIVPMDRLFLTPNTLQQAGERKERIQRNLQDLTCSRATCTRHKHF